MKKKDNNVCSGLKVIPLGGLEQIGLNITAFEYEDSIIVVDCGLSFPCLLYTPDAADGRLCLVLWRLRCLPITNFSAYGVLLYLVADSMFLF